MASTTDNNAMQAEQQTPTATTSRTTQDVKKPIQSKDDTLVRENGGIRPKF